LRIAGELGLGKCFFGAVGIFLRAYREDAKTLRMEGVCGVVGKLVDYADYVVFSIRYR
jgi:hypothetical protein